jgi:hypothetical protein
MPTITPVWRGRPTIDGNTARGASSPAKPLILMKEGEKENQEKKFDFFDFFFFCWR